MISVVVPVYNIAPYIGKCIESIQAQTYQDWELLLVDDGSKDESGAIIDQYAEADKRIRTFHKQNGGVSSARNMALDAAKGEYIAIIDGDDWVEPSLFEDAVNEMRKNNADVFMFEYSVDTGNICLPHHVSDNYYGVCSNEEAFIHSITPRNRFAWTKVFSSKLLLYSHLPGQKRYRSDIILGEDTLFITEVLADAQKVVYSPKVYYHYEQRQGSAVRSDFNPKKLSGLTAYREVIALADRLGFSQAKEHAVVAFLNLGIQLGRRIMESKTADHKMLKDVNKELQDVKFEVLKSKVADQKTKMKAAMAIISFCGTCRLLAGK